MTFDKEPKRLILRFIFVWLACWVLVASASAFPGIKSKESKLVIPDYPTAKDQYGFAMIYEGSQVLAPEMDKRREQMSKVTQCYQRVIDSFPEDTTYTPRSYMQLGDCAAKVNETDKALHYYQLVLSRAENDEYLLARALFSTAQVLDQKQEFARAKATYKEVMDKYANSNSGAVRAIVKRAAGMYMQVHEQPVKKSRWGFGSMFGGKKAQ